MASSRKKVVIVIPTYNERGNIEATIAELLRIFESIQAFEMHICIVDSSSPDGTADIVREYMRSYPTIHLLVTKKEGLGKAYVRGFRHCLEKLNPYVLFEMDADLSHDATKIPLFLAEISKGADFVLGTRYTKGGSIPADWGFFRQFLSVVGNWVIRLGFMNLRITDWTGGYRAIKAWVLYEVLGSMDKYTGYVFQVALLDNALRRGAKTAEVPFHFKDRVAGVSKINARLYSIQTILYVLQHSSFIKFVIVGLSGLLVDIGIAALLWKLAGLPILVANRISMEMAVISNYLLNNFWAFHHKKHETFLQHFWAFLQFNFVALGSFVIQEAGIRLGIHFFGASYALWYKLVTIVCVVIPYSYILYNKIIWRKK